MTPQNFQYRIENQVGIITLDRADRLNALTFAIYEELRDLP